MTSFNPDKHIVNLLADIDQFVCDGRGGFFGDIHGLAGACEVMKNGPEVGVDLLRMAAGSAFDVHTHPGAHILVVQEGQGSISIDGREYRLTGGDSVYIPALYAHGVKASESQGIQFLAFGVPHMPISSKHRMTLVDEPVFSDGD